MPEALIKFLTEADIAPFRELRMPIKHIVGVTVVLCFFCKVFLSTVAVSFTDIS